MTETVAIVVPDMRGSVGAVAWHHALALSRTYGVHVITRAAPVAHNHDINVIAVRPRRFDWLRRFCHVPNELAFIWAARLALKMLCADRKIELVWCHSHAATALVAWPLKKRFGFQIAMTAHGDIFDRPPGTYSRELTWFYELVTPPAYRRADFVQALNPCMAQLAIERGSRSGRARVIPNGVEPEEIGAAALTPRLPASFMPEETLRLLYVGTLWHPKGIDILLRAAASLREANIAATPTKREFAARDVRVTIIGDGPLSQDLKRLAAALGLSDRTSFLGRVPRREMAVHYGRADILCVPSISEVLPTVALEGMLCGLPVVGSNTGGIPFLVNHGVTGYLATPRNVEDLSAAIAAAATSRAHLAELGEQGFLKASRHFAWPGIAEQLDELVRAAILHKNENLEAH